MYCITYYFEEIYNKAVIFLLISSIATLFTCLMELSTMYEDDTLIKYSAISGSIGLALSSICCYFRCKREYLVSNNRVILSTNMSHNNRNLIREVFVDTEKQMHPVLAVANYTQRDYQVREESIEEYPIDNLPVATNIPNIQNV